MKLIVVLLLLCSSLSIFADTNNCTVEIEGQYCVNIEWTEGPHIDAYSVNKITINDLDSDQPINLIGVEFKTWMIMDMHEHGGAEVVTTKIQTGVYENEDIYFFSGMSGTWQFRLVYSGNEYVLYEKEI